MSRRKKHHKKGKKSNRSHVSVSTSRCNTKDNRILKAEDRYFTEWLKEENLVLRVPIYQRHYVWTLEDCNQLFDDICKSSISDVQSYYIGAIVARVNKENEKKIYGERGNTEKLINVYDLVDGQQRMITMGLLLASLYHKATTAKPDITNEVENLLFSNKVKKLTRLLPQERIRDIYEKIVVKGIQSLSASEQKQSFMDDVYAQFSHRITDENISSIISGIKKLVVVVIRIGDTIKPESESDKNRTQKMAQQVFCNINSTGKPLEDYELIHNWFLTGHNETEQNALETEWEKIERYAKKDFYADAVGSFWRHFLIMKNGANFKLENHGLFKTFIQLYDKPEKIKNEYRQWSSYAKYYSILLNPDPENVDSVLGHQVDSKKNLQKIALQLKQINDFDSHEPVYPALLAICGDLFGVHSEDEMLPNADSTFVNILQDLQTVYIRRYIKNRKPQWPLDAIAGYKSDFDKIPLDDKTSDYYGCFKRGRIYDKILTDEEIKNAINQGTRPYSAYGIILSRLEEERWQGDENWKLKEFQIEHIFPRGPNDDWRGSQNGVCLGQMSFADRIHLEKLKNNLGNLTLLEDTGINQSLSNNPYPDKRPFFEKSIFRLTQEVAKYEEWSIQTIEKRREELTEEICKLWPTQEISYVALDSSEIPVVKIDGQRYDQIRIPVNEFEYAKFKGKILTDVHNINDLCKSVVKQLAEEDEKTFLRCCVNYPEETAVLNEKNGKKTVDFNNRCWVSLFFQCLCVFLETYRYEKECIVKFIDDPEQ